MMDLQAVVDIGFMGLVSFVCFQSLLRVKDDGSARKAELLQLEHALKELIEEASAASMQLDRSLSRRKAELERLLERLPSEESLQLNTKPHRASEPKHGIDDLPNETWMERPRNKNPQQSASGLERLAAQKQDTVTLSSRQQEEDKKELLEGFEESAIIDPVAYKIACRLLREGKEIHVVARKLELPVSEVRAIDTRIRKSAPSLQEQVDVVVGEQRIEGAFERLGVEAISQGLDEKLFERQSTVL